MKNMTVTEKKKITQDWKEALGVYEIYKPLHLIKRNGPILCGVYLQPIHSGERYVPIFHTHSLMSPFPAISLCSPTVLLNEKARDSISFSRHKTKFQEIIAAFQAQCPSAFIETLSVKILNRIYKEHVNIATDYPAYAMRDDVLVSTWCCKNTASNELILKYKEIIKIWPDSAKQRFNGEDGWEMDVRSQMDIENLRSTVNKELEKFKLTTLKDCGLLCE
ncbi:hypothetical protein [Photorhabdus kayaii]|uniref:hypothetical protein n=1 Tax=Photorhabdus kayaii TaxID=230088 RepID=UPI0021D4B503|nr:hypothetical protein [Photorhabdus kayaii]MCT8354621.1 hypothetical protein [Photorhabdus kayaii]